MVVADVGAGRQVDLSERRKHLALGGEDPAHPGDPVADLDQLRQEIGRGAATQRSGVEAIDVGDMRPDRFPLELTGTRPGLADDVAPVEESEEERPRTAITA